MMLHLHAFCRDAFTLSVEADGTHEDLIEGDYVPRGLGIGGGDSVSLVIDVETGTIVNWNPEAVKAVLERIRNHEED